MIPPGLAANPSLDRWVSFTADEKVRIAFGKVEYGQGTMTSLAQIGADELDISWSRVIVEEPSTGSAPDEGLTVGSMSTEMSGASVRMACAEVRALFLDAAAARLSCVRAELSVEDGGIRRNGRDTGLSYWSLAHEIDLKRAPTGEVAPKNPDDYRIVGTSVPRVDLPAKVFGAAYAHDLLPKDVIHARVLRQPGSSAKLLSLDEAAIRKAAGAPIENFRESQFVAFLSPSEAAAEAALNAAERSARWENAREVSDTLSDAASLRALPSEAFDSGAPKAEPSNRRRVTATYSKPYISHGSLGPSCAVAQWSGTRLTVWTHAQGVYPLRATIAAGLELSAEQIEIHHMQGPGNYGHNGADDAAFDAALIALRHKDKPIRVQWRRADELAHAPVGTAMLIALSAELDASGRIADYTAEIWSGSHVNRGHALAERALPRKERPQAAPAAVPAAAARPGFRFSGGTLNA